MATITTSEVVKVFQQILPKICEPGKWNIKGREYLGHDGNQKDIPDAPRRVVIELVHIPTGYKYRDFVVPSQIPASASKKLIQKNLLAFGARLHHMKPAIERRAWDWFNEKKARGFTDQGITDLTKRTGVKAPGN